RLQCFSVRLRQRLYQGGVYVEKQAGAICIINLFTSPNFNRDHRAGHRSETGAIRRHSRAHLSEFPDRFWSEKKHFRQ
ncbi:MAG: hypothetical protein WCD40_10170, partial [Candidatus Acidiferrales bacterium]